MADAANGHGNRAPAHRNELTAGRTLRRTTIRGPHHTAGRSDSRHKREQYKLPPRHGAEGMRWSL
jgi:hypothetical protein